MGITTQGITNSLYIESKLKVYGSYFQMGMTYTSWLSCENIWKCQGFYTMINVSEGVTEERE